MTADAEVGPETETAGELEINGEEIETEDAVEIDGDQKDLEVEGDEEDAYN